MRARMHIPEFDPMIGRTIHEFRIEEKLAEGGMGAVYLGRHVLLPSARKVIKVLLPAYVANPVLRRRFYREAEAASKLRHECILGIDNFGELHDGQLFIMVPYLEGRPLDAYLRARGGRLVPHRALHLIVQLCDALDHAHSLGIIHRDLKPSNVYLVVTNANPYAVKLLDFGVAKFVEAPAGPRTHSGAAIGTPSYMAVEQYEHGDKATHLADVYSLAIMIWEMVTGRLPWRHPDRSVLYHLQRTVTPKRPSPAEMPLEWSRLLLSALSVDLAVRPRSMREVATILASSLPAAGRMPSGTEILAGLAPHFMRKAGPGDETVRNVSDVDRLGPLLWPARQTAGETDWPAALPPAPPAPSAAAPAAPPAPLPEVPAAPPAPSAVVQSLPSDPSPPPLPDPPLPPSLQLRIVDPPPPSPRPPSAPDVPSPSPAAARRSTRRRLAIVAATATAIAAAGIAARVAGRSAPALDPAHEPEPAAVTPWGVDAPPGAAEAPAARGAPRGAAGSADDVSQRAAAAATTAAPSDVSGPPATSAAAPVAPAMYALGELDVYVRPWALVYVNDWSVGQTPYHQKLPPGSYRVRLQNKDADKDEVVTVTVSPGVRTTLERTWRQ